MSTSSSPYKLILVNNYSPKGRFRVVFLSVTLTETDAQLKQGGETN